MNICIIPARIGSKRIKEKNIYKFFGKPIISYVIKEMKKTNIFDDVIVSTDSEKIKKISLKYGASIYFKRPKPLCADKTTTQEIVKHAIRYLNKKNKLIKNVCCVYPTAILLKIKHIIKAYELLKLKKKGFIFSASKFEHPIERALIEKKNILKVNKKAFIKRQSNFINYHYYDVGQFYWGKADDWLKSRTIFEKYSKIYPLSRFEAIDINYKDDLKHAKILFKTKF